MLLDPFRPEDVQLLYFDEYGRPKSAKEEGTFEYERVKRTIELYNLPEKEIVEARREIAERITEKLTDATDNFNREKWKEFGNNLKDLLRYFDVAAPFSGFAKKIALGYLDDEKHPWKDQLFAMC